MRLSNGDLGFSTYRRSQCTYYMQCTHVKPGNEDRVDLNSYKPVLKLTEQGQGRYLQL